MPQPRLQNRQTVRVGTLLRRKLAGRTLARLPLKLSLAIAPVVQTLLEPVCRERSQKLPECLTQTTIPMTSLREIAAIGLRQCQGEWDPRALQTRWMEMKTERRRRRKRRASLEVCSARGRKARKQPRRDRPLLRLRLQLPLLQLLIIVVSSSRNRRPLRLLLILWTCLRYPIGNRRQLRSLRCPSGMRGVLLVLRHLLDLQVDLRLLVLRVLLVQHTRACLLQAQGEHRSAVYQCR